MATEQIAFKVTTDTSQTEKSVKSIKTELREATQEALNLSRKFGDTSEEALQAQQRVANLKDEIGDFRQRVEALNPDAKFKAFSQSLQGVAGGFAGLQGAIGLFGTESAELEKQLLKVQSALALSEGLNSVLESKDAFKNLAVVIKSNVVKAFSTLRGAIIATGVGALAVGLGLLIANFDTVKKVVLNLIPGLGKVADFIGKLVEKVTDFVGVTSDASRAYDKLAKTNKSANEEIERRIKLLSAQGGKEEEIAKLSKQQAENDLNVLRAKLKSEGELNEEELKQFKDLKNQKAVIDAEETQRLKDEQKKRADAQREANERAEAERKAAEEKKKKEFDDYVKRLQDEKKLQDDAAQYERDLEASLIEDISAIDQAASDAKDEQAQKDLERANFQAQIIATNYKNEQDLIAKNLEIKKLAAQAEIDLLNAVASTAGQLADLAGKETAAGKALAVAQALINTYLGITAGVKLGFPAAIPAVLAASVTGFKAVKNIVAVKVPGGGGGAGNASPSNFSAPSLAQATQAPIQAGIPIQQTQTVGTANVNVQNQQVIKAYVVERDITDSQDRVNKIKQAATI